MTAIGPKDPRTVCCRAQENDRPHSRSERQPSGHRAGDQPGHGLLQAATGIGQRPEADEPDRPVAHGIPLRRQPHAARPADPGELHGRAAACRHADEADGHRGAVPQAQHVETGAGAQGLPLSAAQPARHPAKPGLGDGHHRSASLSNPWRSMPHSRWRGASSISRPWSTGSAGAFWPGGYRSRWKRTSASRPSRKPWPDTAQPKSSIPIRAASSPRPSSSRCWPPAASGSAWMARARGGTILGHSFEPAAVIPSIIERLRRTIKYEEVYLHAYASVPEARAGIGRYLTFYNSQRPHSSLCGRTPDQAYFNQPMPETTAA